MTSLDVNEADSLATLLVAHKHGVNFFDTAYCYGFDGLSERLIAQAFAGRRDEIVIATKCFNPMSTRAWADTRRSTARNSGRCRCRNRCATA